MSQYEEQPLVQEHEKQKYGDNSATDNAEMRQTEDNEFAQSDGSSASPSHLFEEENNSNERRASVLSNSAQEDNNIQVINRSNNNNNIKPYVNSGYGSPSSGLYFNENFDLPRPQWGGYPQIQQPLGLPYPQESDNFTQFMQPSDYNQLTLGNQSRLNSPLPPLPPLSEPVVLKGFNIPPALALQDKLNDPNQKRHLNNINSVKRRKENNGHKTRPQFVMKIWSMVNDPANHEYIRWNDNGKTFQVFHREEFMKLILPKYFKHNNFASFVRQLNMYGWHKVQDISNGTLNKDDRMEDEVWQFENPYFIRGREDLLDKIVRNKSINQESETGENPNINFLLIMNELEQIKMNQIAINEDLRRVRKDNKTLWNENYLTRERSQQQGQTLDKILKFLAAVYGNTAGKLLEVDNAPFGPDDFNARNQVASYNNYAHTSVPMSSSDLQKNRPNSPSPFNKPRLLITQQAHLRSPSESSSKNNIHANDSGSIEDMISSLDNTPQDSQSGDVNKMYNQLVHDAPAQSPRFFFPELYNNNSSVEGAPNSPNQLYYRMGNAADKLGMGGIDPMNGLEQNISKQGQSIQQVQDWILKLAEQQQIQQQQLVHQRQQVPANDDKASSTNMSKPETEDFDVNQFLDNTMSPINNPTVISPLNDSTPNKRNNDDSNENGTKRKRDS